MTPTYQDAATHVEREQEPLLSDSQNAASSSSGLKEGAASNYTILKTVSVMICFSTIGMCTAAVGALIPLLEKYFTIRDGIVAWIFVVQMTGYLLAATNLERIHLALGRRGVGFLTGSLHLLGAAILATRPSFSIALAAYFSFGLGSGCADAGFCAWAAAVQNANTVQGLIHGSFSVGSVIGPLIVAALGKGGYAWNAFYVVSLGVVTLELCILLFAFYQDDASTYRASTRAQDSSIEASILDRKRPIIHCALFYLCYVGIETSLSAWLATFMNRSRGSSTFIAAMTSSIFWGGMAAGRFTMGAATRATGLRKLVVVYILLSLIAQLAFRSRLPLAASLVLVAAVGFSFGPIFPAGILMLARQLPTSLQVRGCSVAASVGQLGGAISPFLLGLVADSLGIERLLDLVLAMSILLLLIWTSFCRPIRTADLGHE